MKKFLKIYLKDLIIPCIFVLSLGIGVLLGWLIAEFIIYCTVNKKPYFFFGCLFGFPTFIMFVITSINSYKKYKKL